jgi:hypothetical protein
MQIYWYVLIFGAARFATLLLQVLPYIYLSLKLYTFFLLWQRMINKWFVLIQL